MAQYGDPNAIQRIGIPKDAVNAEDLSQLKERLNTELSRRNRNGSVAGYAEDYTKEPAVSAPLDAQTANETVSPVTAVADFDLAEKVITLRSRLTDELRSLAQALDTLEGESLTTADPAGTSCRSACSGACVGSCGTGCGSGCGSGCTASCGTSCSGCGSNCASGCGNRCSGGCGSSCSGGCRGSCDSGCGSGCTATCGNTCGSGCGSTSQD